MLNLVDALMVLIVLSFSFYACLKMFIRTINSIITYFSELLKYRYLVLRLIVLILSKICYFFLWKMVLGS